MKRNLFIFTAVLATFTLLNQKAKAQDLKSVTVPVTITLSDAFSITLGTAAGADFVYNNAASYTAAQSRTQPNQFSVISNKAYSVAVSATAFTPTTTIGLGIIQVAIDGATAPSGTTYNQVPLATTAGTLIATGPATVGTSYNVKYSIPDASSLIGKPTTTPYSTNVTYTITQP